MHGEPKSGQNLWYVLKIHISVPPDRENENRGNMSQDRTRMMQVLSCDILPLEPFLLNTHIDGVVARRAIWRGWSNSRVLHIPFQIYRTYHHSIHTRCRLPRQFP